MELITTFHKIKILGISLEELYSEKMQVRVHLTNSKHEYTLVLIGRDKEADFLLSSWSGNYYVRSNKGMNRQKYTSLKGIENAVLNLVKKHICDTSVVSYSLSSEIYLF
jgi:cystathionine beta-lyase family protein involved in aluminum resistance